MNDKSHPSPAPHGHVKRKQLLFRAWHRGTKEMDLVLGHYADAHLDRMTDRELDQFEALIGLPDHQLYQWVTGREPIPAHYDTAVMREACAHVWLPIREAATEGLELLADWYFRGKAGPIQILYRPTLMETAHDRELEKPRKLFDLIE